MPNYFLLSADNHRLHLQKSTKERTRLPFALDSTFLTATFMTAARSYRFSIYAVFFVTTA